MLTTAKLQVRQVQGGFETLTGRPAYRSGSMMAKVSWLVEERAIRGSVRRSKQAINTTVALTGVRSAEAKARVF